MRRKNCKSHLGPTKKCPVTYLSYELSPKDTSNGYKNCVSHLGPVGTL